MSTLRVLARYFTDVPLSAATFFPVAIRVDRSCHYKSYNTSRVQSIIAFLFRQRIYDTRSRAYLQSLAFDVQFKPTARNTNEKLQILIYRHAGVDRLVIIKTADGGYRTEQWNISFDVLANRPPTLQAYVSSSIEIVYDVILKNTIKTL